MNDLSKINDKLWAIGEQRATVIRPLAEQRRCSKAVVLEAAKELKVSKSYVYRLVKHYRISHGLLTALIPQKPNGGKGKSRLSKQQEDLIHEAIEDLYLTPQKLSPTSITEEIRKRCFEKNIETPSNMTIRRRIQQIPCDQLKKRGEEYGPTKPIVGCFPDVEYPLSVVQIDHTPVDIIIVDPIDRLPIGRPYLTLAIDCYSRCIAGFVLSLEAPSAVSVGLCLTHVAMDKTHLLSVHKIDALWLIHGKPKKIYVDNGSDFHSEALTRGCDQHGIQIEYRPPGTPHYGGTIERVIGTMMKMIHDLPGTTFSNINERGTYDSDKHACLTLSELEHWLMIAITKYYHVKFHNGINQTPIKLYEQGAALMKRNGETFYTIQNGKQFLIDFLPIEHRLLRREGFMLDHIAYYTNALRPLISELTKGQSGKFLIRRDPRDLSRIYVFLPQEKTFLEVPYRTLSHPNISLFEHRLALKRLKDQGKQEINEISLFQTIDEMRNIINAATTITRSVRRNRTRMQENKKVQSPPKKDVRPELKMMDETVTSFANIEMWE